MAPAWCWRGHRWPCTASCQYLFGWGYQSAAWADSDMFSGIQFRVPSTLENPNMLGQYLILLIPLGGAELLAGQGLAEPGLLPRLLRLSCAFA
ncbi:MAG: hypothetical protein ACLUJG_18390 [Lawsonibacter sp.]